MKVELRKNIRTIKAEFVGEVDFFEESPYIDLLKNIETKEELIELLENKKMRKSAINNIVKKLEDLKVLVGGNIVNINDSFPQKEYGKYCLEIFKNDTFLPFKYKTNDITRIKAVSKNTAENIKPIQSKLLEFVENKHNSFSDNKSFRIVKVEAKKGLVSDSEFAELNLIYEKETWIYQVNYKKVEMDKLEFDVLFHGEWDDEYDSLKVEYSWIKDIRDVQKSFQWTFDIEKYKVREYGEFIAHFKDIPIIPKTEDDALKWFINLLKLKIEEMNRYISKEELKQLWLNLKDDKPKFKKFDLEFDFEMILKEFGKSSKFYWLLQAGIDLYPFDNLLAPKNRVIIESINDFKDNFNIDVKKIIIMDTYLNTTRHYKILEEVLYHLNNPEIIIFTAKDYKKAQSKDIEKIILSNNIKRIIKDKQEIEHSRYWILNEELYYKVGESLDGIKKTSFDLYSKEDIDKIAPKVSILLKEIK